MKVILCSGLLLVVVVVGGGGGGLTECKELSAGRVESTAAGRLPPSLVQPRTGNSGTADVDIRSHWRSFSRSISKPGEGRPSSKKGAGDVVISFFSFSCCC